MYHILDMNDSRLKHVRFIRGRSRIGFLYLLKLFILEKKRVFTAIIAVLFLHNTEEAAIISACIACSCFYPRKNLKYFFFSTKTK